MISLIKLYIEGGRVVRHEDWYALMLYDFVLYLELMTLFIIATLLLYCYKIHIYLAMLYSWIYTYIIIYA